MMTIGFVAQDDPKLPTDINHTLIIADPSRLQEGNLLSKGIS